MAIDGLIINENSLSTASQVQSQGFTDIYVVITSSTVQGLNALTSIKDAIDFATKFPSTVDACIQSIKLIFINNPNAKVSVISGSDSSVTGTGDTKTKADLLYAINRLTAITSNVLAIVLCPQQSQFSVQADRTTVYSALESLCSGKRWLSFINTAFDCATKLAAITERALYASPRGNSALYYGYGVDNDNKNVPVIGAIAAIALARSNAESIFAPPGSASYPVKGLQSVIGEITQYADYQDMKASNINMTRVFASTGRVFWLARTLAADPLFLMINSRMAMSITSITLENSLVFVLFDAVDPNGTKRREVLRICESIMQQLYLNGAFSGETPEKAYQIIEQVTSVGDLKKIQVLIYARFVGTLEMIQVDLTNVDEIPVAA